MKSDVKSGKYAYGVYRFFVASRNLTPLLAMLLRASRSCQISSHLYFHGKGIKKVISVYSSDVCTVYDPACKSIRSLLAHSVWMEVETIHRR